jgi:hypothetical protein
MAVYWQKSTKELVSKSPHVATSDDVLIVNKGLLDRTSELPTCDKKYVKFSEELQFPVEMTTQEKAVVDSQLLTEATLNTVKSAYSKYQRDGIAYFETIRAELVVQYKTGQKTAADIFEIEGKLEDVIAKLIRGDWMTANFKLQSVQVGGALSQTLYDSISSYITSYITNNY